MKRLIVVESPAKARKIQGYFRDGTVVKSSFGHIRDLDQKTMSIDIDRDFAPVYQTIPGKGKVIKELSSLAKGRQVILAADDDREGDAIAWHCGDIMDVDFKLKNRIIFHEISDSAIQKALRNVHTINMNSVNAQQARRIIDRLVGFSLSPLLWKHIDTDRKGLSAGRVQSTVLSLLKKHEELIEGFESKETQSCLGEFKDKTYTLKGGFKSPDKYDPVNLLNRFKGNRRFQITSQESSEEKKYSPKPLITSSLQQISQKELRFSVAKTMTIAQKLYDSGKITYLRTDSPTISSEFQGILCNHIKERYSKEYYQPSVISRKVKGAQEAHECIRITRVNEELPDTYTQDDIKLYNLIKEKTICSHMKPAIYNVLNIQLSTEETRDSGYFESIHKVLRFKGYLIYFGDKYKVEDQIKLESSEYQLLKCLYKKQETNPPSHYNESSMVKKLEDSGIGRPSTYAAIIGTLYSRNYTETLGIPAQRKEIDTLTLKRDDNIVVGKAKQTVPKQTQRILLTPLGKQVLSYLEEHFSHILDIDFTAKVESDLDRIAEGSINWVSVVKKVYDSFITEVNIQKSLEPRASKKYLVKELGTYEGEMIIVKSGPYGPYLNYKDRKINLKYLLQRMKHPAADLELSDVIDLVKYPMVIGHAVVQGKKESLVIQLGPYGKYLRFHDKNYRVPQKDSYTFKECIGYIKR